MVTGAAFPSEMAPADAVMWAIERDPVLRSTVTAVSLLDRAPDHDRLRRRLLDLSRDQPRLRQRVGPPRLVHGLPTWVDDPAFDIDYHLRRYRLAEPGGLEPTLEVARISAMAGLDRSRPLWEFTVLEGLEGGGAAFIQKFHHCVTDGVGGVELAARMLDGQPQDPAPEGSSLSPGFRPPSLLPAQESAAAAAGHRLVSGSLQAARAALSAAFHPVDRVATMADNAQWAARLLAPARSPLSPVMRARGTVWQFRAFDVDLAGLRVAAGSVGGSVNDIFLTAVTAGLRRYHEAHGCPVTDLRITLPISIRKPGDAPGGNRFTPVRFTVPLGTGKNPADQARRLGVLVREWRTGRGPALTDYLASLLCRLPPEPLTALFGQMLKNVDFVATNVAGMAEPMYLAGAEILRQYAFAPLSGAAVNIALLSHVDKACIGVNSDAAAVPDPDLLRSCLIKGFGEALTLRPPRRRAGAA